MPYYDDSEVWDRFVGKNADVLDIAKLSKTQIVDQITDMVAQEDDQGPEYYADQIVHFVRETLQSRMRERINGDADLEQYADIIGYDWQDDIDHLAWVVSAPKEEIISWAAGIRENEAEDQEIDDYRI